LATSRTHCLVAGSGVCRDLRRSVHTWSQCVGPHLVAVCRPTLGRSVSAALDLLAPIAEQTRSSGVLGTDATGIRILDPKAQDGIRTGVMWCWTNARWVTFDYSPTGDSDSVRQFLGEELARTVQCDGTAVVSARVRAPRNGAEMWWGFHGRDGFRTSVLRLRNFRKTGNPSTKGVGTGLSGRPWS